MVLSISILDVMLETLFDCTKTWWDVTRKCKDIEDVLTQVNYPRPKGRQWEDEKAKIDVLALKRILDNRCYARGPDIEMKLLRKVEKSVGGLWLKFVFSSRFDQEKNDDILWAQC